jgi:hypothetical protein
MSRIISHIFLPVVWDRAQRGVEEEHRYEGVIQEEVLRRPLEVLRRAL